MQFVTYGKQGHIAYITMNRPERLNAAGQQMEKDLEEAEAEVAVDDDVWVSILSGNGRAFCAGFDLKEQAERVAEGRPRFQIDGRTKMSLVHGYMYEKWHWKPTIAAVHGYCVGRGLSRALDCDLRICSDDALFSLPEVQRNIAPVPTVYKLASIINPGMALWMALTTDEITGQQAKELGLVGMVTTKEELMPTATALAERICSFGPESLRATKRFFYQARDMSLHQAVRFSDLLFRQVEASTNAIEGTLAFVEKRATQFQGV